MVIEGLEVKNIWFETVNLVNGTAIENKIRRSSQRFTLLYGTFSDSLEIYNNVVRLLMQF